VELPIVTMYKETVLSWNDPNLKELIRLLDIDGTFLISGVIQEKTTGKFIDNFEISFSTLWEAQDYLRDYIDIEEPENEREWKDYDHD
jgi:hypothetical protein